LIDDQVLFRGSLGRFLATQPGLEVAGECGSANEAIEILSGSSVDIVLVGLNLRTEHGDQLISAAWRGGYKGRFLILVGAADAKEQVAAMKAGASGVFLKSEAPDRLVEAIRLVASGAVWVDQKVIHLLANQIVDGPELDNRKSSSVLSDREERVLLGVLGGLTNRKIGDNMGLSESSIKSVVQQLFVRAGVRTRSQLVRMALEGSLGAARELVKREGNAPPAATPAGSRKPAQPAVFNPLPVRPSHE
jgi:DNA-binding NarL/FixJ family response regulator